MYIGEYEIMTYAVNRIPRAWKL